MGGGGVGGVKYSSDKQKRLTILSHSSINVQSPPFTLKTSNIFSCRKVLFSRAFSFRGIKNAQGDARKTIRIVQENIFYPGDRDFRG